MIYQATINLSVIELRIIYDRGWMKNDLVLSIKVYKVYKSTVWLINERIFVRDVEKTSCPNVQLKCTIIQLSILSHGSSYHWIRRSKLCQCPS